MYILVEFVNNKHIKANFTLFLGLLSSVCFYLDRFLGDLTKSKDC